jgi:threonine dehydratase
MSYSIDVVDAARKITNYVRRTEIEYSPALSELTGVEVWLKLEHLQHTGSFKWRGALNRLLSLSPDELERGIVTASNGNHGLAVCRAGRLVGVRPRVYLREGIAAERVELIRQMGGDPCLSGQNPLEAEELARAIATQSGQTFISPYNDPWVIAGQGTIGLEIAEQLDGVEGVFVAVGGGGLIAGIGAALREVRSGTKPPPQMVGCWPENSPVLYECLNAGRIIEVDESPTISDSTAGGIEEGSLTLPLCKSLIDQRVLVTEEEICRAMRLVADHERWMVEGAAGVALAGLLRVAEGWRGRRVVVLLCGRNIATARFAAAIAGNFNP